MPLEFEEISDEEAKEELARKRPQMEDEYTRLLDVLKTGRAVRIPVKDKGDAQGKRIAIGHRATQLHMQLAYGYNPDKNTLTVQKARDLSEEEIQQRQRARQRRRELQASS